MRRTSLLAASVIALTMALPMAQASAAPASSSGEVGALACGYYLAPAAGAPDARYRHCTSEPYAVQITIKYRGGSDRYRCMQPNEDARLGSTSVIYNAFYNGNLC